MKTNNVSNFAFAFLLAASPVALAASAMADQDQQQSQTEYEQTQPQTSQQPAKGEDGLEDERQAGDEQDSIDQSTTAQSKASMQTGIPGQIVLQSPDTYLGSKLLGTYVYAPDDVAIGEVKDLILDLDGGLAGVVIGVGGFLGIGVKQIAVQMDAFTSKTSPDGGAVLLYLNATQEELENAPAFKTTSQQKLEEDAARAQEEMQNRMQESQPVPTLPAPEQQPQ